MHTTRKPYAAPRLQTYALQSTAPLAGSSKIDVTEDNVDTSEKSSTFKYSDIWDAADSD